MPITDIGSYVTTGHEFEAHWGSVDADRLANSLTELALPGGYTLVNLTADINTVATAITNQEDLENALSEATNNRDTLRKLLREKLIEFRESVDYNLKGSGFARALPSTPHENSSEQKILKALDDMESVWTRINAATGEPNFSPPLILRGTYTLADFSTDLATLRTHYRSVTEAENDARIGRKQRDVLLDPLRDRFVAYRQSIKVEYGEEHAFFASLPDVYTQGGSTPDPVSLSGDWDEMAQFGVLNWTESTNPNLQEYKIRMTPGPSYDSQTATVVGTETPGVSTHSTIEGLANSGDVATFKVYVVLTTGNESGSNPVTITRP